MGLESCSIVLVTYAGYYYGSRSSMEKKQEPDPAVKKACAVSADSELYGGTGHSTLFQYAELPRKISYATVVG